MSMENQPYLARSIAQVQDTYLNNRPPGAVRVRTPEPGAFSTILDQVANKEEPVRFSKHAAARLYSRGIEMSTDQMERLNIAKAQAGKKGIQDSLILVDELAFIVNVPNNTVVTAMDKTETESNIFTNIDGAVIG